MEYPYIGESKMSGSVVLFYSSGCGVVIDECNHQENYVLSATWVESMFKNITREYLANTYGEVESKEHYEFVAKLADSAGCNVIDDYHASYRFFNLMGDSLYPHHFEESASHCEKIKITLPLPPKEEDMKSENMKSEEWPISGCDCIYEGELYYFLCKSPFANVAVITKANSEDWDVISASYDDLEKPPTPEEALAELIDESLYATVDMDDILKIAKVIINGDIEGVKYEK